jgi:hypothetical protein
VADSCEHRNEPSGSIKDGQFLASPRMLLSEGGVCSIKMRYYFLIGQKFYSRCDNLYHTFNETVFEAHLYRSMIGYSL